jgi:hypothetical protein
MWQMRVEAPHRRTAIQPGAVAEWLKATVLKTVVSKGTGGSNPSCSVLCQFYKIFRRATKYEALCIDLAVACETMPLSLVQHDLKTGFKRSETDIKARSDGENRVMNDYLREYSLYLPFSFLRGYAHSGHIRWLAAGAVHSYNLLAGRGREEIVAAGQWAKPVRVK